MSYAQHFDYDRFGNLYRKNASNPTSGQASPLLYTPIEDADISKSTNRFTAGTVYDNAGNVTQDTKFRSLNFSYDANGRVYRTSNTDNTNQANSVYDASGKRVATQVDGVWTFFVYDIGGKLVSEYGGLAAMDEGGVKYILSDWQGSSRAILSNSGFVQARMDYTAFGEEIGSGVGQRTTTQGFSATNNLSQKYGLTERDKATGLDHTWFRKNENRAGRWTSPDPSNGSMSLGNPQSFNRYSYVENQPANFVDPSGLNMAAPGNNSWSVEVRISWFDSQWEDYWGADNGGDFGWLSDGNSGGNNETGGGGGGGETQTKDKSTPCDKLSKNPVFRALAEQLWKDSDSGGVKQEKGALFGHAVANGNPMTLSEPSMFINYLGNSTSTNMELFANWAEIAIYNYSEKRNSMPIEFTYFVHTHPVSGSLSPSTPRSNADNDKRGGDTKVASRLDLPGIIVVKNKFSIFLGDKPSCIGTW